MTICDVTRYRVAPMTIWWASRYFHKYTISMRIYSKKTFLIIHKNISKQNTLRLLSYHSIVRAKSPNMEPSTVELLKSNATPFASISQDVETITKYFDSFGDCKVLLIGDASHGTSEFYTVRAEITKYMIENHGFNIVAVEADWPDAEHVDRYVRNRPGPGQGTAETLQMAEKENREPPFLRFPTWMWRNMEVHDFIEWMRSYNSGREIKEAAGFYGLDLYSLGTSMKAVIDYLDTVDKDMAEVARQRYIKLMDWSEDPHEYGLESLATSFKGYEEDVIAMLQDLLKKRMEYSAALHDGIEFHSGEQNARVVKGKSNHASLNLTKN